MRKALATLALGATSVAVSVAGAPAFAQGEATELPRIATKNGRHALIVDGAPVLMLGAQVNTSSNYASALPQVFPMLDRGGAHGRRTPGDAKVTMGHCR